MIRLAIDISSVEGRSPGRPYYRMTPGIRDEEETGYFKPGIRSRTKRK